MPGAIEQMTCRCLSSRFFQLSCLSVSIPVVQEIWHLRTYVQPHIRAMVSVRIVALLAGLLGAMELVSAAPTRSTPDSEVPSRVDVGPAAVVTPPPCVAMTPAPSVEETKARFDKFAHAFLVTKNLTEAFEYISASYRNHNPFASGDGPGPALDVLGPIWPRTQITVLGTTFNRPMSWLHYRNSMTGEIVDRYRWDAGCIVEHWDQGEKYPGT
ncbi:snoal-like polyketide cyclase family protein [Apiospora arundinis]